MNSSYTEKLKEGEEIRLFPKRGEESIIYFDNPYSNFNYEIKFLGRANSSDYNMNIIDCEGIQKTLDNNNKIIRGNCKNVDYKTKITLTNNGIALTGIIIKRAFSKNLIKQIINNSLNNELNVGRDLTLIKYEKNLNNLFYFYNYVNPYSDNSLICLYQDYLDIDYLSFPPKYSCFNRMENFSSYQNLSVDYNMVYNENNSKGKLIDSDYLYLIINSSKYNTYINFRKIFKINATNMELKDIISESDYDGYFYIMPKKTNINNYNSLFLQAFEKNSYQVEFKLYKNLQIFSKFSISTSNNYEKYNIQEINIENQLMLYIEHSRNSLFRFIFYNSEIDEYNNYDYKSNLITSNDISLKIKDKTIFPYKIEIKPYKPHEIKGCSNYYFFALKPKYNPSIQNYYDFKLLNSSVFYQNFTAENVCSENKEFYSQDLEKFSRWGYGQLPICVAKTQNSISHDKTLLGAPKGYEFPITEARLSAGAGFIVVLSGNINTMPGLPSKPAAEGIDVTPDGKITGLF